MVRDVYTPFAGRVSPNVPNTMFQFVNALDANAAAKPFSPFKDVVVFSQGWGGRFASFWPFGAPCCFGLSCIGVRFRADGQCFPVFFFFAPSWGNQCPWETPIRWFSLG
eukprot:UN4893